MRTYKVYDKVTRMYVGIMEISAKEDKSKYADFILVAM